MSAQKKRQQVFRQLPLRAQLATIVASKANKTLSQNQEYIASLEKIHAECLATATPAEKQAYQKAQDFFAS